VAGFEKTAKTPRAGRFPPPRRGPKRRSRLGLLTALDAARRPSPPRPQRGPRRRRRPLLRQSRNRRPCLHDLASSTAVRLLWRKPRNLHSVGACALDPGVDATAAARPEFLSRLPFTAVHRTVHRPQHLHGSSSSTLHARVPATKDQAQDHTAQLTIH